MEKQKVYIETSVISYLTARQSRDIIISAHQQITTEWWENARSSFDCYISDFVIGEISRGDEIASRTRLQKVDNIELLASVPEIEELGDIYANLFNIPIYSKIDAYHLAIAVWYKMDYLLSWNCKHIANAIVNRKLWDYNVNNNLYVPVLCTPDELMEI